MKASYTVPSAAANAELYVVKMTEKFSRNPTKPARDDIAKHTFYTSEGRVQLYYHYEDGAVTRVIKNLVQSKNQPIPGMNQPYVIAQEARLTLDHEMLHAK